MLHAYVHKRGNPSGKRSAQKDYNFLTFKISHLLSPFASLCLANYTSACVSKLQCFTTSFTRPQYRLLVSGCIYYTWKPWFSNTCLLFPWDTAGSHGIPRDYHGMAWKVPRVGMGNPAGLQDLPQGFPRNPIGFMISPGTPWDPMHGIEMESPVRFPKLSPARTPWDFPWEFRCYGNPSKSLILHGLYMLLHGNCGGYALLTCCTVGPRVSLAWCHDIQRDSRQSSRGTLWSSLLYRWICCEKSTGYFRNSL